MPSTTKASTSNKLKAGFLKTAATPSSMMFDDKDKENTKELKLKAGSQLTVRGKKKIGEIVLGASSSVKYGTL